MQKPGARLGQRDEVPGRADQAQPARRRGTPVRCFQPVTNIKVYTRTRTGCKNPARSSASATRRPNPSIKRSRPLPGPRRRAGPRRPGSAHARYARPRPPRGQWRASPAAGRPWGAPGRRPSAAARGQPVQSDAVGQREPSAPLAAQRRQVRADAQPDAEVVGQGPHVEARRTGHPHRRRGTALAVDQRELGHLDLDRRRGPPAGRGAPGRRPGGRRPSWPTPPEAPAAAGPGIGPAPPRPSAGSSATA